MSNPATDWWQTWFKTWEMAVAAPMVIALRSQQMMLAGHKPSAKDRREMVRMGQEKTEALTEGITAMALAGLTIWQQPWKVVGAGLAPSHRRVIANRRRLTNARSAR